VRIPAVRAALLGPQREAGREEGSWPTAGTWARSEPRISPLRSPEYAVDPDTTRLTVDEQVEAVVALVRDRTS
jgi:hypothetical protein